MPDDTANALRVSGNAEARKKLTEWMEDEETGGLTFEKLIPAEDYDECCTLWGTKWNPYSCQVHHVPRWSFGDSFQEVVFCTAWNPPLAFLHNISKMKDFSELTFELEYTVRNEVGRYVIKNGMTLEHHDLDQESAAGISLCEYLRKLAFSEFIEITFSL